MKLRQSVIEGCERNGFAKDMCELHYRRNLANGNPLLVRQGGKPKTFCSVADCDKPSFGHGLCNLHYKRWRKGEIFKLGPHSESPE